MKAFVSYDDVERCREGRFPMTIALRSALIGAGFRVRPESAIIQVREFPELEPPYVIERDDRLRGWHIEQSSSPTGSRGG